MGVFTRRLIKEDLDKVNVFLEDINNEYFVVQDLPDTFSQGRTTFKIFGSSFLKDNVPLKIEILDKSGETVYVQPVQYGLTNPKLPYRYVSVEVYREINVPGEAKLVILGELDPTLINVPQEFQGTYNVKFSKTINIDTFTFKNTQPILFYKKPTFTAQEVVSARKKVNPQENSVITGSQIFGKVKDDLRGSRFLFGYDVNSQENSNEGGKSESPTGDVRAEVDTYKYKTGLFGKKAILSKRGIKEERASEEPPQMRIFSNATTGPFTSKMVGGTIDIRNIQLTDAQKSELANLSQEDITALGIDASEISNFFSTDGSTENLPDYSAKIERVVSSTELITSKPYSVFYNEGGDATQKIYSDIGTSTLNNANFTASFVDWDVPATSSFHFDSFVDVDLRNLRTFSGDIYRVKVYGASDEATADFPVLLDTVIESPELLRDTTSPSGFLRSGYFKDQAHIDKYWTGSVGDNITSITSSYDSSLLIDGVLLSGSYAEPSEAGRFELNSTYAFTVKKDIPYTLTFRAKGKKTTKNNLDGTTTKSAKLLFHLSGSNLSNYDGKTTLTYSGSFGSTITDELNRPVGLQIDDTNEVKNNGYVNFGLVSHTFFPKFNLDQQTNTDTILQVRVDSGVWVISDVSLRPAQDTGFSPDEFSLRVPIPPGQNNQPNNFDFLVEYYDVDGNVAETATFINDVKISGSALIIQGSDNMLTGSLFLGNLQGSGIEMKGGSAFIRAVGYKGFKSASLGQGGGFFMWSGSVAPGGETQDNYTGAGLEIHDGNTGNNESFFKFRTIDADNSYNSTFDVKTSRFFFGDESAGNFISGSSGNIKIQAKGETLISGSQVTVATPTFFLGGQSQFISGSNGNIEISSSNFHLQNDGDVVMQGTITAEAGGTIGGFTINANDLTGGSGASTIKLASGVGIHLGNANLVSAPFSVTNAGVLKAESGTIGGWTLGANSFTGGKMLISNDGTIQSTDFQSNVSGKGFKLTADDGGFLEVENAKIRGTLKTTVFEKESVNAVGGQLYIANSTVLTGSSLNPGGIHTATQTTMSVENASGFVEDEILAIKKVDTTGFSTEYVLVNSASRNDPSSDTDLSGNLFVQRGYGSGTTGDSGSLGDSPSSATSYSGSQVIVSTGKPPNTGYMRLNANPNDKTTPYMDIVERTGSGLYDVELKTRLGDLSGVAGTRNVPSGFTGFGLMSEVAFLSGSEIRLEAPRFLLGDLNSTFVSGSNSNLQISSSKFHLQESGDVIINDITASNANVSGKITATSGQVGGFGITDTAISGSSIQLTSNTGQTSGSQALQFYSPSSTNVPAGTLAMSILYTEGSVIGDNPRPGPAISSSIDDIAIITHPTKSLFVNPGIIRGWRQTNAPTATEFSVQGGLDEVAGSHLSNKISAPIYGANSSNTGASSNNQHDLNVAIFGYQSRIVDATSGKEFRGVGGYFLTNGGTGTTAVLARSLKRNRDGHSGIFHGSKFVVGNVFGRNNNSEVAHANSTTDSDYVLVVYPNDISGDTDDDYKGRVGINKYRPSSELDVNGTISGSLFGPIHSSGVISGSLINSSGDIVAFQSSDEQLKDNLTHILNPIEKVKQIGGYEFDWNDKQDIYEGHDIGVIAQEVEKVMPELVRRNSNGYKAVKYEKLVPLLIESIKDQQKQIDELKKKFEEL